ncbi:tRNA (guanosine(46)-N7)-methyltransferase TrmB [Treponema sp. J25]|nr:tRNA (guanosine(46)-N7)-methyltransferase TrmB [Treponema sp. J25]
MEQGQERESFSYPQENSEEEKRGPSPDRAQWRRVRSFVLRAGRMTAAQERSYTELAPRYCIPYQKGPVDMASLFGNTNPVTIEIGFGMGDATARIAEAHRECNYLGIEVHRPGVGKLLWEIEQRHLENIRIIEHDAVEVLMDMIPDQSVAAFHIFFPDPWPKKRHHKRRLIQRPFTDLLVQKLKTGGYVYMTTDWEDYAYWALREFSATPGLLNPYWKAGEAEAENGFARGQQWRPETKFERKGKAKDHRIWELYLIKGTSLETQN